MNNGHEIRIIATITLWTAPLPAAFFVGRSVYYHLIYTWHLPLGALGLVAAIIAGMMIELVGILSAHTALATGRWNRRGDVRREHSHKERAPFGWAVGCFAIYALAAVALAVVLEWVPEFAVAAPALFTIMAAAAYLSVGIYEQHLDRLHRYGITWAWLTLPEQEENNDEQRLEQSTDVPDNDTDKYFWECPRCDFVAYNRWQKAGHANKHSDNDTHKRAHKTKGEG